MSKSGNSQSTGVALATTDGGAFAAGDGGLSAVLSIGENGAGAMVTAMESAIVNLPFARLSAGLEGLRGSENVVLLLRAVTMSAIRGNVRDAAKADDVKVGDVWAKYGYADLKEFLGAVKYTATQFHADCRLYDSGGIWATWVAGGLSRGTAVIAMDTVSNELKRRNLKRSMKDVGPVVDELNTSAAALLDGKTVAKARVLRKQYKEHGLGAAPPADGAVVVVLPLRSQYAAMLEEIAQCDLSIASFQSSLDKAIKLKDKLLLNCVTLRGQIKAEDREYPATASARDLAHKLSVDIRRVVGTGAKGNRVVKDVKAAAMVSKLEDVKVSIAPAA